MKYLHFLTITFLLCILCFVGTGFAADTQTSDQLDATPDPKAVTPKATPDIFATFVVDLIDPSEAPNVTDAAFDAIYSNGSTHQVIEGNDWKDWLASQGGNDTVAVGAPIANVSKAYFLTDMTNLYFGMLVYDSDTNLMTADTGDDTYFKYNFESIEVAFSALANAPAKPDSVKIAMDAFGNIDDMMPEGSLEIDTSAKTNHNSYIIDSTTWACEFSVGITELIDLSVTNLVNTLPAPGNLNLWYAHIGYQSVWDGDNGRVPLYAAYSGSGFSNFRFALDLSNAVPPPPPSTAVGDEWLLYE